MTNPTVHEIVESWLRQNGYDGLYFDAQECGCFLTDLMPCDGAAHDCKAGYWIIERNCDGEEIDVVVAEKAEVKSVVEKQEVDVRGLPSYQQLKQERRWDDAEAKRLNRRS
jgi:hypothetical protein